MKTPQQIADKIIELAKREHFADAAEALQFDEEIRVRISTLFWVLDDEKLSLPEDNELCPKCRHLDRPDYNCDICDGIGYLEKADVAGRHLNTTHPIIIPPIK